MAVAGYLLDAHALLWWLSDDSRLPAASRAVMADSDEQIHVSAVTAWEIAIKRALGKLRAPEGLQQIVAQEGFSPLAVDLDDGERAANLPRHHNDPFDRMLVAQAQSRNLTIITRDAAIAGYAVATLWDS